MESNPIIVLQMFQLTCEPGLTRKLSPCEHAARRVRTPTVGECRRALNPLDNALADMFCIMPFTTWGGVIFVQFLPPCKPPSAPLPIDVGQGAALRVYVRGNGGMVLVRDVNLSSCYSSTPPSLGVRNWKVVLPSALVMRKSVLRITSIPISMEYSSRSAP